MPIYQCAAPVGLLTRDMKARIAAAISGEIVVPFVAGEVNLVMQPGQSGHAAVTVLLDGKPIVDARGTDVGADGVALRSLGNDPPRRRRATATARADTRLERPGAARKCSPSIPEEKPSPDVADAWVIAHQSQSTLVCSLW